MMMKGGIPMAFVEENFGINVFNDSVMRQRLPKETYKTLHKTIETRCHTLYALVPAAEFRHS